MTNYGNNRRSVMNSRSLTGAVLNARTLWIDTLHSSQDQRIEEGVAEVFQQNFRGSIPMYNSKTRHLFCLMTKELLHQKLKLWNRLKNLRKCLLGLDIRKLSIPKLGCKLDSYK
ncbi:hypothetical protein Trydic_g22892 [Trypoxylus dichotomus]